LRFWRESSLIIPKNYGAPRGHGIPLPMLSSQTRFSYCLTGPKRQDDVDADEQQCQRAWIAYRDFPGPWVCPSKNHVGDHPTYSTR
jgi:hypothetical protein